MIGFSSDIDWAPEEVIADMLSLFTKYNVKCTLFCTHQSKVLEKCNRELFEIAVHPNYNSLFTGGSGATADEILQNILSMYPEARGVRSHSLSYSSGFLEMYRLKNIEYHANQFFPYSSNLQAYKTWNGIISIPYNWEDDVHWAYGHSFENSLIDFDSTGLKIFDFHPIHIYLNTDCQETYNTARPFYQDAAKLLPLRNNKTFGARDLLIKLLEKVQKEKLETLKHIEISELVK